jgi:hypothetical protein
MEMVSHKEKKKVLQQALKQLSALKGKDIHRGTFEKTYDHREWSNGIYLESAHTGMVTYTLTVVAYEKPFKKKAK